MQNIGEGWGNLLDALTDEELSQYGQMAQDQIEHELGRLWRHILLVTASIALIAWAIWQITTFGIGRTNGAVLGLGALLLYWPYRSVKALRLWRGHCRAVEGELEKRNEGVS